MLLIYSLGLAAIAHRRLAALREVLYGVHLHDPNGSMPFLRDQSWSDLSEAIKTLPSHKTQYTPRSEHLFSVLRDPLRRHLPSDHDYDAAFDRLEYLIAMSCLHLTPESEWGGDWTPPGRFAWKIRRGQGSFSDLTMELEDAKSPVLKAGFFVGDSDTAKGLHRRLTEFIGSLPFH